MRSAHLDYHLWGENDGKNVVGICEKLSFCAVLWDIWPLHGKRNAIQGDEEQNSIIEPFTGAEMLAVFANPKGKGKQKINVRTKLL